MTDAELIKKIASGDPQAFEKIFQKYKSHVYGLSLRLLASSSLAEDNSQETWIKVVQAASQYEDTGSAQAWILRIAKNTALNTIRKRGWEQELTSEDSEEIADTGENVLELISASQDIQRLKSAMDQLPDRQRVILILWLSEENDYSELANEMQIRLNAAKVLLFRAKENLARLIKEGT